MTPEDQLIVNTILANYGKVLEAYVRKLVSRNAPFDQFVGGDSTAMSATALRGAQLFVGKARCISCHNGPNFSNDQFHNLGVPQVGLHVPATDDGRFKDVPPLLASPFNSAGAFSDDANTGRLLGLTNPMPASTKGQFRTPSLRGVAQTAPYMHSGQFATLGEVIDFYDAGGGVPASGTKDPLVFPLQLSTDEKADLLAFLAALSGEAVPAALLVNTSK
jgi:cytochrome c peroxidase